MVAIVTNKMGTRLGVWSTGSPSTRNSKATRSAASFKSLETGTYKKPADAVFHKQKAQKGLELWTERVRSQAQCCQLVLNWPPWECRLHFSSQKYNTARVYHSYTFYICVQANTITNSSLWSSTPKTPPSNKQGQEHGHSRIFSLTFLLLLLPEIPVYRMAQEKMAVPYIMWHKISL